jgi:hypothetical protein
MKRLFELCQAVRDGSARPDEVRELARLAEFAVLFPARDVDVKKPRQPITKEVVEKWCAAMMPEIQKAIDAIAEESVTPLHPRITLQVQWP